MKHISSGIIGLSLFCTMGCNEPKPEEKKTEAPTYVSYGLEKQLQDLAERSEAKYKTFEELHQKPENAASFRPYYDKAQRLKKMTKRRIDRIDRMKTELWAAVENISVDEAEKQRKNLGMVSKPDDYERTSHYFGVDDSTRINKGKAAQLKKDIESYRDSVLSGYFLLQPTDTGQLTLHLDTKDPVDAKDGKTVLWEKFYFYHLPYPAANTELTKWQNNLTDAELQMLDYLMNGYLEKNPGSGADGHK